MRIPRVLSLWRVYLAMVLSCIALQGLAREPVIELERMGSAGELVIGRYLGVLEDSSNVRDIRWASAAAQANAFVASDLDRPNFGYSSSAFWLRFTINPGKDRQDVVVVLAAPTLDDVQLYSPRTDGTFDQLSAGDQLPWSMRPVPHRNFVFRTAAVPGAPSTFYLRIASSSSVTAPLTLWRPAQFEIADQQATLLLGMFYGLLAAQLLYNLFLYFSLRDRAYLLYVGYVAAFGLALSVYDGLAFQYLWPNSVEWANRSLAALLFATLLLGGQFVRVFLEPRQHAPLSDRLIAWHGWGMAALTLCSGLGWWFTARHYSQIMTVIGLASVPLVLWMTLRAMANGYRPARFFLLAWAGLLVFMSLSAMRNFAFIPVNFVTSYGLHVGLALDVILLSTALADRIRVLREDMIAAQSRLIGASHHYQEVLEGRATQLAEANQELENFSYTVAHDLRSPLRAIDAFSNLIRQDAGDSLSPQARHDLDQISQNARKMAQLIDGLLDFSRIGRQTPDKQMVDMQSLAEEAAQAAQQLSSQMTSPQRGARIHIHPLPPIEGDAVLFKQVWANLLDNAVKYSARASAPTVDVSCEKTTQECVFSVRDNGVGFDAQYAGKLFGMFQRLHNPSEFEGTGVGLAIVKRVVERHGGRVWATSTPGNGACFYFSVPVSAAPAEQR